VKRKIDLPPQERDPILRGLMGVTHDPKGTAHGAFLGFPLDRFPVAGKTGTAQVAGKQDTALFASFAPANSPTPEYAIVSVVEEAGFGGSISAPIVRRIYDGIIGASPAGDVQLQAGHD
jgi:penicillin-binding protein 2